MKQIQINLAEHQYSLFIEPGLINRPYSVITQLGRFKKLVIITDSNVNKLYGAAVKEDLRASGCEVNIIELEPGEDSKSMESLEYIYNKLLDYSTNRDTVLIALGGGVIGDITGFAASTFLRGIKYIQIPTSLIAQVDSSIGGKVAVNLKRGKNLIGSFYHPIAVLIDPKVLNTLEEKYFNDGMAEVIKYGLIKDIHLFKNLEMYKYRKTVMDNIEYIITTCCNIKKEIVQRDEKDTGERMLLNFGHTIGHGVEAYYDYKRYSHGEAVAIGMYLITCISENLGFTKVACSSRIKSILNQYNLPYEAPQVDTAKLLKIISTDKKVFDNGLNFILIKDIGDAFINRIPIEKVGEYLNIQEVIV